MKAAVVISYGRPWAGREATAMTAFQDAVTFFGKLAADDRCDEPITYLNNSGRGMMIVHGDRDELRSIVDSDDFRKLYLKAGYTVPDLALDFFAAGESGVQNMGEWAAVGAELGYM